ncbi:unnamed protein product [Plutella xylostella]|uniref:(diamondback moth) hypothetical protein n=1 Tax=Plutella xylostella TaxID=51655 RepID=A0A8S4G8C0_PLUXY|nr:unnamed protein product [Plutella xylostella]
MIAARVMKFHRRCGDRVTLLNDAATAIRNFVDFNHGLILSAEPLKDDIMFEVRIDRKVPNIWNGSIEIGVTTLDPEYMELPATATKLRNTAWILSGNSILKDGVTLTNHYGPELDSLREGDTLGVIKSSKGELMFFVNGHCLGIAARELPPRVFAVIDLYGQCVQVTIMNAREGTSGSGTSNTAMVPIMEGSMDEASTHAALDSTVTQAALPLPSSSKGSNDVYVPMTSDAACALVPLDRLRFHTRCGILVKLSNNNKSAERSRPLDDYNNGVVMTHRPLNEEELFEIRIDKLVDKWSGSIEVGVTTHSPATIRFPSTMTNMDSGTIMMSGCKVLVNGQGTCMEYGNFNLDELREGDTVGMMKRRNGKLHYYINGVDQGVATDKVEPTVWGVIDLYGMTVKVTIVDACEAPDTNVYRRRRRAEPSPQLPSPALYSGAESEDSPPILRPTLDEDTLLFHTLRDSNVVVINDGKTAHRPNCHEYFNNGIVMTNRTLKTNELFQVRLDVIIPKWAGSIEIGVTQHTCNEIQFPFKMSNAKSGTWVMTGEDVIRDGVIIMPQYVRNLNKLVEGDTVGVMRKDIGILHFFVNGVDQGPAAFNIPEHVFGVIDLYGRVAQATLVEFLAPPPCYTPETPTTVDRAVFPEMCFHRVQGRNARLSSNRLTANRASTHTEFCDAIVFSSRPLREGELFEVRIDKLVDAWCGGLELGVTAMKPDDMEANGGVGALANTATDLNWDTYILSGTAVLKDGECVRSTYPLNLDHLKVGNKVGIMWHSDKSLHYYLNGMDQGKAWYVTNTQLYAVVDLYGQCAQVSIVPKPERRSGFSGGANSDNTVVNNPRAYNVSPPPPYCFSEYCGENVLLSHQYTLARRKTSDLPATIAFSAGHLVLNETFELKILECSNKYMGNLRLGVTDVNILNAHINRQLPSSLSKMPHFTSYIDGNVMKTTKPNSREHGARSVTPSFYWLKPGDRLGLKKVSKDKVLVYYNSELMDRAFEKVPDKVYVCIEMHGVVSRVQAVSRLLNVSTYLSQPKPICNQLRGALNDEAPEGAAPAPPDAEAEPRPPRPYTFHYVHGDNIKLTSSNTVAMRTTGFSGGVCIVSQAMARGDTFRCRIDKMTTAWSGSVGIGAVGALPTAVGASAVDMRPPVWAASCDIVNNNGRVYASRTALALNHVREQSVIVLHFRPSGELLLEVDGRAAGRVATVPRRFTQVYPLVDLYGRVEQVSVLLHPYIVTTGSYVDLPLLKNTMAAPRPVRAARDDFYIDFESYDYENVLEPGRRPRLTYPSFASIPTQSFDDTPTPVEEGPQMLLPQHMPDNEPKAKDINNWRIACRMQTSMPVTSPPQATPEDYDEFNRSIQRSQQGASGSTGFNFMSTGEEMTALESEIQECLRRTFASVAEGEITDEEDDCDTNIRHNDRYPENNSSEADNIDHIDNEIITGLTLDPGTLPDLTEGGSSSSDESIRGDFDPEPFSSENLRYLHRLLGYSASLPPPENPWHAPGGSCEHLHLVLKFWSFLMLQYPELRHVITSFGKVECYCTNCKPDCDPVKMGWVSIQRMLGTDESAHRVWHVERSTVAFSQACAVEPGPVARPLGFMHQQVANKCSDIWFDEEGKPHLTVVALEIELDDMEERDRLLSFQILLKPHTRQEDSGSE